MRSIFSKFALLATFGLALAFTFSCSSGGGGGSDDDIVNAKNEVWKVCNSYECYGIVIGQNEEWMGIYSEDDGDWKIEEKGTYSIEEGQLTLCNNKNSDCRVTSYGIFGNRLIVKYADGDRITFTRTSNVHVSGNGSSNSSVFKNSEIVFVNASIPTGTTAVINSVQYISDPSNRGSGTLIVSSSQELSELYLKIDGKPGYYVREVSDEDISFSGIGSYVYSINLNFSAGLLSMKTQQINLSVKTIEDITSKNTVVSNTNIAQTKCNAQSISGGEAGHIGVVQMGQRSGSFRLSFDTYTIPDKITIYDGDHRDVRGPILYSYEGGSNGTKTETVYFNEPKITVEVIGLGAGTSWVFLINCPD